ncbi:hypothetical protein HELRODRAFT_178636 [Helobdella robusta]|uniref:Uncharacterized protein n=1 Tax=Helobdella robusta TaxID=6412 RepID=T1FDH3_HELRO|nr:hypothetical protein HELRODRAFT_178636 [Helobdella robusta]ESN96836.1 hypothetical protein HELRODRAFT_178636 [Helobdella robusta]
MRRQIAIMKEILPSVTTTKDDETKIYKIIATVNEVQSMEFIYSFSDVCKYPEVIARGFVVPKNLTERFNSFPSDTCMIDFIQQLMKCKILSMNDENSKIQNNHSQYSKPSFNKNASMKTASDVINRIRWDPDLETTDFSVGYLDRFLGVLEKKFDAFTWEDIASADYDVLAIPKHRIQYFKYKDKIVWDKRKKIDNIFGSTGNGLKINDIIDEQDCDDYIGCKYPACEALQDDVSILTGNELDNLQKYGPKPSHFLCQRISDKNVTEKISEIQKGMLNIGPAFEENIIPPTSLHCTLCTVSLSSQEDISTICDILDDNKDELKDLSYDLQIEIEGLSKFFNRVIYASVLPNENLNKFVDYLKYILQEGGIQLSDSYEFVPHVTLLKLSHDSKSEVPNKILDPFLKIKIGSQTLDEINLCEISKIRDDDGFYKTVKKLNLD